MEGLILGGLMPVSAIDAAGTRRRIDKLQELGGWSDYSMVYRYAHLSVEHLAKYAETSRKAGRLAQNWHSRQRKKKRSEPRTSNRLIHQVKMARPERFELPTAWFVARYSIQLSYGRMINKPQRSIAYSTSKMPVRQ